MLLIGITGMASAGKSTLRHGLVYKLKLDGYKVEDIHEMARAPLLQINENINEVSQIDMLMNHLKYMVHVMEKYKNTDIIIITDRTPFDYLAHMHYYKIPVEHWWSVADYYTRFYDRIFVLNDVEQIEEDGLRDVDLNRQQRISKIIKEMFEISEIDYDIIKNYQQDNEIVDNVKLMIERLHYVRSFKNEYSSST